jgi:ABC-type oligopeptide transport system ATPase subunit
VDSDLTLKGFRISNFRSFSEEQQQVGPLKKFNIIIGENNSGKSNVARFLQRLLSPILSGNRPISFDSRDRPQRSTRYPNELVFLLAEITEQLLEGLLQRVAQPNRQNLKNELRWFLDSIKPKAPQGHVWVPVPTSDQIASYQNLVNPELLDERSNSYRRLHSLWSQATGSSGGGVDHWLGGLFSLLTQLVRKPFALTVIHAGRKIETALSDRVEEFGSASSTAKEFIQKLATYERPDYTSVNDKDKWNKIQSFVRTIMKDEKIAIEIPARQDTINFNWNGRYLPIEDLGTGVYQAILLAARATIIENTVVCIEEPELHFHPELQRQIMQYLDAETKNQYFITTHSAHVMDAVDSCIIGVTLDKNGDSKIDLPMNSQERRHICHRLGYRPSDLLQSNCLIWIEGPSDRIYLNHWIAAIDSSLEEGWHYSFALYGGRLLSNFAADEDDQQADEFIQLLPVNRFPAVLMDSDIKTDGAKINATKARIETEVIKAEGYCWITEGREIENYIPYSVRLNAVKSIHTKAVQLEKDLTAESKWCHPLAYLDGEGSVCSDKFDKPGIARFVSSLDADLSVLDLSEKIKGLIEFIHKANRIHKVSIH